MSRLPVIPYYKVTRLIQEGGTSAVYQGIDLRSRSVVAIKALFSNKAKDSFMLKRFREEANHYLLLSHPNIPKLVDFVIDEGQMYLIMEYVEGIDMNKYLQANGPLDEDMTVHFFTMILDTIGYLHTQGILHLDIKPSNIMVTEGFGIKILDLGISAMVSEGETLKKKCGSPSFMAPEQINGEKLGYFTDIYQIGVTLFNMITGKLPYSGNTQQEIFDNIIKLPIPKLIDFSADANEALQVVIDKSMAKKGDERYESCEQFEDALLESLSATIVEEEQRAGENNSNKEIEQEEIARDMKIITVGRELGNDIVIGDSYVGRHHLELIKDEAGTYFVRDLNSTNGTFVNGQRITGEVPIDEHDIIRIGNTTLPWISYFVNSGETEVEEEEIPARKRRRKRTPEEEQARKEKRKKAFAGVGKWLLRTIVSIGTMLLMYYIFSLLRK